MKKYFLIPLLIILNFNQVFAYNFDLAGFFGQYFQKRQEERRVIAEKDFETASYSYSLSNPKPQINSPIAKILEQFNSPPVITNNPTTETTPARVISPKETALQKLLSGLGVSKSEVKQFQRDNKLGVDGIVGPKTTAKIKSEISDLKNESQNGTSKQEFQNKLTKSDQVPKTFQELLNETNDNPNSKNNSELSEMKDPDYAGNASGELANKFKKGEDGSLETTATFFGGPGDMKYNSECNGALAGAVGKKVNTCSEAACVVSLPLSVLVYYYGNEEDKKKLSAFKKVSSDRDGFSKQIEILGSKNLERIKREAAGKPIQIVNKDNNICAVGPAWDIGPKDNFGGGIDLSQKCAQAIFDTKKNFKVLYKPLRSGEVACEGNFSKRVAFPSLGAEDIQMADSNKTNVTQVAELEQ